MNKAKLNYFIDLILAVLFFAVFVTGIIKLPELKLHKTGLFNMSGLTFIHDWSGVLLGVFIVIHLVLHWNWIVCMTRAVFKKDGGTKCKT